MIQKMPIGANFIIIPTNDMNNAVMLLNQALSGFFCSSFKHTNAMPKNMAIIRTCIKFPLENDENILDENKEVKNSLNVTDLTGSNDFVALANWNPSPGLKNDVIRTAIMDANTTVDV